MSNIQRAEEGDGVVTKRVTGSVDATVKRFCALVEGRGLQVFSVIDHSGEARRIGLELRDTQVVIFGSPAVGTPVMQAAPLVALELPLKVLVWDDAGQTKVSYTAPRALGARYHLTDELAQRLAGIDALSNELVAS